MNEIYLTYGGIITPLGVTEEENFTAMLNGISGIHNVESSGFNGENWPLAKIENLQNDNRYDSLLVQMCDSLIERFGISFFESPDLLVILSSTKANINQLPGDTFKSTRDILRNRLKLKNKELIISNACISGVLAINTAADYLKCGKYKTVLIIGIDVLSDFIVYGFQSLFALSNEKTKPFDVDRKGISIGEACGAVILSTERINDSFHVEYLGGSSSNDANHISGPSRSGEGLFRSINRTIERANITTKEIDLISAHGTGTLYNDEMESIAIDRLDMNSIPLNSLKGYFGHTLGAAGVIEVISTMLMMEKEIIIKSLGYENCGTSKAIDVIKENQKKNIRIALKTASGFGGGNASLILKKI